MNPRDPPVSASLAFVSCFVWFFTWVLEIKQRSSATELSLQHSECYYCVLHLTCSAKHNHRRRCQLQTCSLFSIVPPDHTKNLIHQKALLGLLKASFMLRSEAKSVWTWDCCGPHRHTLTRRALREIHLEVRSGEHDAYIMLHSPMWKSNAIPSLADISQYVVFT